MSGLASNMGKRCFGVNLMRYRYLFASNCMFHGISNLDNGLGREFGIQRERENLLRCYLRPGKSSRAIAEISIRRLQVDWDWIVDAGLNSLAGQRCLQVIAVLRAHRVNMVHMPGPRHFDGCFEVAVCE